MMSTDGIELTNFINPDLTWKTVAKGSRSATRRTRKSVAQTAMSEAEAADKSATGVESGGVSDSEKLGVAVLGRHFKEKVEHVPIKKRKFMFRSPSPPPSKNSSFPHPKFSEQVIHIKCASKFGSGVADGKTLEVSSEKLGCIDHDFSGIEILADVACKSGMGNVIEPEEESPMVEELVQKHGSTIFSMPVESNSLSAMTVLAPNRDIVHEGETEIVSSEYTSVAAPDKSSAGECDGKLAQGRTENLPSHNNLIAIFDKSSSECDGKNAECEIENTASLDNYIAVIDLPSANKHCGKAVEAETENMVLQNISVVSDEAFADEGNGKVANSPCLRDDRSHWDLNLSMDAWEQRCDFGDDASQKNIVEVSEKLEVSDVFPDSPIQRDGSDHINDHVDGIIPSDQHGNILMPSVFNAENEKNSQDFQSGYDSQFEDGELRESYPCWEDNGGDEIEHVDYDSEPEDERYYALAESDEKKIEDVEKGIISESGNGAGQTESGDALVCNSSISRMRTSETNECSAIEKHVVCSDDFRAKSSPFKGFGSRTYKREFPSRLDGPLTSDSVQRRRSDIYDDSFLRDVRDAGSDKFIGRDRFGLHIRGRSPGSRHFGFWDSKRHHSSIYNNGSYNFGHPRQKSLDEGRGFMTGSDHTSSGIHGHFRRRQFSNSTYQSRFRRYPEGLNQEFRGSYRSLPSDSNEYSWRLYNRLARRDRSNSPVFRRLNYPQPCRKSQSRSRSRSPISWNSRKRSPNFRMDKGMDRVRLPFQKRFPADHEMGFMSPSRDRGSPQHHSRWFEDRNYTSGDNNNSRGRKSPGRMFRPNQRLDSAQSVRRVNSENRFRSMMHSRRFIDGAGEGGRGGRGRKYGCSEENKHGNRYDMIHRSRRYDIYNNNSNKKNNNNNADGGESIQEFKYNGEEFVVVNDS